MKRLLISLFLTMVAFTCFADDMSLDASVNENQFTVTLPANPTTGFQWTVENYDKSFLKLVASRYMAPHTQLMGAGGQMSFTFQLIDGRSYPQNTTILFKYARSWEPETRTMKKVTVHFTK
jgi:inhibitor of cysteine peptidase